MQLFPAIDLRGGQVVRLTQGDYDRMTVYGQDPCAQARSFVAAGAKNLHVVDLDGAKDGTLSNYDTIAALAKQGGLYIEVGGGIRTEERIETYLSLGVGRCILGSVAVTDFAFTARMLQKYGDKIAVGVDAKDGYVAIHGWKDVSAEPGVAFCQRLAEAGCKAIIYTDIACGANASIDTVLVNAVGAVSATVNIVVTASFALIISVYMSLGTESLGHQARTLVCAYLKPSHAAGVLKFCRLFRQSFANFLTGQCSEAVILGVLMALAFSVFKIPYGSLVGVLTAICAIIPYVGALISCVVSVFLVLLVDPVLAVRGLIVYLAVQFIENQFIYPRVVGKSVGLSPLYTLVAAMIGGELFGIIGIIFFIPLTAVVIELVKEDACRRLRAKEPLQ